MRIVRARSALVLVTTLVLGCGGSSAPESSPPLPTPLGQPLNGLTVGQWNWVPFPDAVCGDGSATGIGVNPGTGSDLVLFLDGGGACSSGLTCFGGLAFGTVVPKTVTTLGPFGEAEFSARVGSTAAGSIVDRTLAGNPFATATLVLVPYCTGDVHGGDRVVAYNDFASGTVHHAGHANVLAYLKRIAATYPAPTRVILTGSSAGGFGTIVNYESVRAYYPVAQGVVVDDSGPLLENNGGLLIQAGLQSWGISDIFVPLCGAGVCDGANANLSKGMTALLQKYPQDRFALLSWDIDDIINAFYFTTFAGTPDPATTFAPQLRAMLGDVFDPAPNGRYFVAAAPSTGRHVLLDNPAAVSQGGVSLLSWLAQEVTGSAPPASVKP